MSASLPGMSSRRFPPILISLAVGCVAFLTYLPALRLGFLDWDDDRNIVNNLQFRGLAWTNLKWMFTTFQTGPYQPLSWITLGLDYCIWGLNPIGYHLTNLLLHAISASLLVLVVARLAQIRSDNNPAAVSHTYVLGAIVGLLWALHPLRVEPVAWTTERRELLCGMLTLLTLLHELRGGRRRISFLLGCAAMLAKATAVVLPVMLVTLDIYRDDRYPRELSPRLLLPALRRRIFLIAAAAVFCILAIHGQREATTAATLESVGIAARLVLYFNAVAFYFAKTICPFGLTAFYPIPVVCDTTTHSNVAPLIPRASAAAIATIVLLISSIRRRDRIAWLLPLLVVYLAAVAPISGLIQVGGQYAADRYAYQPTWIATLALILAAARLMPKSVSINRAALAAAPIAIALAILSVKQLTYWRNNISLWTRELEVFPDAALAHFNLAVAYSDHRSDSSVIAKAENHFRSAVKAIPSYTEAWSGLGDLLAATNRRESALEYYNVALQTNPSHLPAIRGMAESLWALNRKPEALDAMRALARYDPHNENAHLLLAKALANAGQPQEAIAVLESAMRDLPNAPVLRRQLIWLLSTHPDPAIRNGKRAVALVESSPPPADWPDVMAAAVAFAEAGDFNRAAALLDDVARTVAPQQAAALKKGADQFRRREPMRAPPMYP